MKTKEIKTKSLSEMKDKYIGKTGTKEREEYEYELRMDVLGKMIKTARQERHLTQEELGKLIGVQKAQISKLENSANSATIDTVIKVFKALKAEINFKVKIEDNFVELAWQIAEPLTHYGHRLADVHLAGFAPTPRLCP